MATIPTFNSTIIARVAAGLYDLQLGNATMDWALEQVNFGTSVEELAQSVYDRDFAGTDYADIAAVLVDNLGISARNSVSTAVIEIAETVVTDALTAGGAGNEGATIVSLVNLFSTLTTHPDVGLANAAKAFNQQILGAVNYAELGDSVTRKIHVDLPEPVLNLTIASADVAGFDALRLTGDTSIRIDFTNPAHQITGVDVDGDGVIEFNGTERTPSWLEANVPAVTANHSGFEVVDAYSRNPLDHTDTANNFTGDIYFDGTSFAGAEADGTKTDGNIFLGGLGSDEAYTGVGNDFLAGGGIGQDETGEGDYLSGGRNADFFFAEFSAVSIDSTDGGVTLSIDGGDSADDTSAGNGQSAQDSDWLLFEANDDDEPVQIWQNDDNVGPIDPDGNGDGKGLVLSRSGEAMVIDDVENIDASGNLYGFLDDVDVEIGGRGIDDRDTEGTQNYGLGSTAQLDIEGSEAGNKILGGYDNDSIAGNGGGDLLFGGNLQFLFQNVPGGVTNPNLANIFDDGRDELLGGAGDDNIVLELDKGIADGGDGNNDTLWITNYTVGRHTADKSGSESAEAASAAALLSQTYPADGKIRIDLGYAAYRGYRGDTLGENTDHSDEANQTSTSDSVAGTADQSVYGSGWSKTTITGMENVIATGMGGIDYLAAGANKPELAFDNQQNFYGTALDLELRGTDGDTVVFTTKSTLTAGNLNDATLTALYSDYLAAASANLVDVGDLFSKTEFKAYLVAGGVTFDTTTVSTIAQVAVKTGNNTLYAGSGDDIIEGRGGDDLLSGGPGNDDFVFGLQDDYGHGGDHGDNVDVIHRQKQDATKEANITDGTFGRDFGLDETAAVGSSVLRIVIKASDYAAGDQLTDAVNFVSEIVTGVKNADGTFTTIALASDAIKAATTYQGLVDALNAKIDASYPNEADNIQATLQADGVTIFITDALGRELADNLDAGGNFVSEVTGAGVTVNQKANTTTNNVFEYGAPIVEISQDRIIYKSYEDRSKNEGTDDDSFVGSTISLGKDDYANDLVIDFNNDTAGNGIADTRLAEDQQYSVQLKDLSVEDVVTIAINDVKFTLQVGVAVDGTLIAGETNNAFVARLADFINEFLDDDTAAGKVDAFSIGDTLGLTQAAYSDGDEVVFMRTPVVTLTNLSGGQKPVSTVTNISSHEVLLLDFDGRDGELNRDNVLFVGEEFINRAVLETAKTVGGTLLGSDSIVIYVDNNDSVDNITSSALEGLAGKAIAFNTTPNLATDLSGVQEENFSVHGDDLLIGGDGLDNIQGGTGDDRIHGSRGGTPTNPELLDGGKDLYLVDGKIRVLNTYEAGQVDADPKTISIEKILQTESGFGLEDGFQDTLLLQQRDLGVVGVGGAKYYIELSADLLQKKGGEGWVSTTENGVQTGFTYFTNFEHIRTVAGDGTLAGQGDDTLDFADLSTATGGVFYNLSNNIATDFDNDFPNGPNFDEAGPGSVIINFGENWDNFLDASDTTVAGDTPIFPNNPDIVDRGEDDGGLGDDELFTVVDGVENVIGGLGDDGVYVDETEAGKNNLFNLGLGSDIVLYGNAFEDGAHLDSSQVPTVTLKVNTGTDTDTIEMVGGRVGTVAAKDTLIGVEAVSFAFDDDNLDSLDTHGVAAGSSREDDVLDVSRVSGATVDFTNGYITTGGTVADGGTPVLIAFGMSEFENVTGSAGNDQVIIDDDMFNSREDEDDGDDTVDVAFDSFLNYDFVNDEDVDADNDGQLYDRMSVAELRAIGLTGSDINPFGADDIPEGYNIGQFHFNLGGGTDTVDYFEETGLIAAVIVPGALTSTILVSHDGDEDLTDNDDRVDVLGSVERIVASQGQSILDFTAASRDVQIDFQFGSTVTTLNGAALKQTDVLEDEDIVESTVRIADGNGNQIQGLSSMIERYDIGGAIGTWDRIEGSDFAEKISFDGSEDLIDQAGIDHRYSDDLMNLRGGNNSVSYSPLETSITAVIEIEEFDEDTFDAEDPESSGFIKATIDFQDGQGVDGPGAALPGAGTHTIYSFTGDNKLAKGSLKLEASQDAEDTVSFISGSDKVFVLGSSPGVLNVSIGTAGTMVLTGFEFLQDADSNDVYTMSDLDNVVGQLTLIDDNYPNGPAGDDDTIKVFEDAINYNGGAADQTNAVDTVSLESLNDAFAFDFNILDVSAINDNDLVHIVGDDDDQDDDGFTNSDLLGAATYQGPADPDEDGYVDGARDTDDDVILGDLDSIDDVTLFTNIWLTNASIASSGKTYVLDTTNLELDDNNSKLFDTDAVGLNFSLLSEATGGVTASIESSILVGGTLVGSPSADTLTGGGGDDTIKGGGGADILDGGTAAEVQTIDLSGALAVDGNFASFDWLGLGNVTFAEAAAADTDYTDGDGAVIDGAGLSVVGVELAKLLNANLVQVNLDWQTAYAAPTEIVTGFSYAGGVLKVTFATGVDVANPADLTYAAGGDTGTFNVSATSSIVEGSDGGADVFQYAAASEGGDTINGFVSGVDAIEILSNVAGNGLGDLVDDNGSASFSTQNSTGTPVTLTNEIGFVDQADNGASTLTVAGLSNLSTIASVLEANFDIGFATSDDALFVVESDTAGTYGVYYFDSADTGGVISAAELKLIAVVDSDIADPATDIIWGI